MLSDYFKDFEHKVLLKSSASKSIHKGSKAGEQKDAKHKKISDPSDFKEVLDGLVPVHLNIDALKPVDASGFSPLGADLIAYKSHCRDIANLMNGYIPCELIYGTFHIVPHLDRNSLYETLNKVMAVKKLNRFAESTEEEIRQIPAFLLAMESGYSFLELKNDIINFYLSKNIEYHLEMDILCVLEKGLVVKNWREKRNFIALETVEDSMMWFFVLMSEYLDVEESVSLDLRKYIKKDVVYKEF